METTALFGIAQDDGMVRCARIEFDGYIEHAGVRLAFVWNTVEKITELLDLGNVYALSDKIGTKHDGSIGAFDPEHSDDISFMHRDVGLPLEQAQSRIITPEEFYATEVKVHYLFAGDRWFVRSPSHSGDLIDTIMDMPATLFYAGERDGHYLVTVEPIEHPQPEHARNDKFAEVIDFADASNGKKTTIDLTSKMAAPRIVLETVEAMVAFRLRYSFGDEVIYSAE